MPQVSQATLDSADLKFTLNSGTEQILVRTTPGPWSVEFTEGGDYEALVIAPGGASGPIDRGSSGGASGGDVIPLTATAVVGTLTGNVGSKGLGTLSSATSAGNTDFNATTAIGGGYGGYYDGATAVAPVDGGGAAERSTSDADVGAAHPTSFAGGDSFRDTVNNKNSGGGRGAGGDGGDATDTVAGEAGAGILSAITGSSVEYGRGGSGVLGGPNNPAEVAAAPGVDYGSGASGGAINDGGNRTSGADGAAGAIILRFALPTSGGTTVSAGDVIQFTYVVPDTAGNSRTWITASVTVT